MTLTEFLLARINEDETTARSAIRFRDAYDDEPSDDGDEWEASNSLVSTTGDIYLVESVSGPFGAWEPAAILHHISRWDPARALAECEAKRQIVDFAFENAATIDGEWGCCHSAESIRSGTVLPDFDEDPVYPLPSSCYGPGAANAVLLPLAQVYAEHPDFDPAWRT